MGLCYDDHADDYVLRDPSGKTVYIVVEHYSHGTSTVHGVFSSLCKAQKFNEELSDAKLMILKRVVDEVND